MSWPPSSNSSSSSASKAVITGMRGIGNPLTVVPPDGYFFSGVQFYRNGVPIPGDAGEAHPYIQVAADVAPGVTITAEITGLMMVSSPF